MRVLKLILATLSALLGLVWLVGMFLPGEYRVERSTVIDAPVSLVFAQVNSFPNWEAWSPWLAHDPSIETTYSGPAAGVGHASHWRSENSGEGSQTITVSEPNAHITTRLDFGDRGTGEAEWAFAEVEGHKTRVTWSMAGEHEGAIGHYFAQMMDGMIGPYFEEGLQKLKERAEQLAKEPPPQEVVPENPPVAETEPAREPSEAAE